MKDEKLCENPPEKVLKFTRYSFRYDHGDFFTTFLKGQ